MVMLRLGKSLGGGRGGSGRAPVTGAGGGFGRVLVTGAGVAPGGQASHRNMVCTLTMVFASAM